MKSSIEDRNKAIEKLRSTLSGVFESEIK
jgi:hypothetical protein